MKKLTVFVILLSTLVIFGCNQAQQKPVPPEQTLTPKESSIGFSQVDIDELPSSIQKVASAMEERSMVTWANDNNNSYILLNTDQEEENLKVSKVIQRVPVQDFLWLDVQLDYLDSNMAKDLKNNSKLVAVKLDRTDKGINGVGFEIKEESEEDREETKEEKPQPAPAPTPTPITREPANQVKTTQETAPEGEPAQNQAQPNGGTQENDKEDSTSEAPNGE